MKHLNKMFVFYISLFFVNMGFAVFEKYVFGMSFLFWFQLAIALYMLFAAHVVYKAGLQNTETDE